MKYKFADGCVILAVQPARYVGIDCLELLVNIAITWLDEEPECWDEEP